MRQIPIFKKILALSVLVIGMNMGFSQPPTTTPAGAPTGTPPTTPPSTTAGSPCWDEYCIPIDGGIVFLLMGAGALGYRVIRKNR